MSQPILTTASGSGILDPNHSLSAGRPLSASAQGVLTCNMVDVPRGTQVRRVTHDSRAGYGAELTSKLGLGGPMGARMWIGLILNVGGLAVVLQSLARHGVGA